MTLLVRHTDVLGGVVGGFLPYAPFFGWRVYSIVDTYVDPTGTELPAIRIKQISGPDADTMTQHGTRVSNFRAPRVWPYGGGQLDGYFPDLAWYFLDPATHALVAGPLVPIDSTFSPTSLAEAWNSFTKSTRDTPVTEHAVQWFEHTLPTGPYIGVHVARSPSETYPLWVSGHPVEIVEDVLTRKGEAYDAATAAAVILAMNPKLHHLMPVTGDRTPQEVIDQLSEGYGFTLRASATTGEVQFVYWREKLGDISGLPVIDDNSVRGEY